MQPRTQVTGLVAIQFALTLAMGLGFGAAGTGGGPSNVVSSTVPPSNTPSPSPKVIVVARGVNSSYLYQSSSYSPIPAYMFEPLNGIHVALTSLSRESLLFRQRLPAITLRTNSSGIAYAIVAPGNYSVSVRGPNFDLNTTLSFGTNTTTTIRLNLEPTSVAVKAFHMVSPDTLTGVEPVAKMTALLGNLTAPVSGFAELVGFESSSPSPGVFTFDQVVVNATVVGSYPENQGYWAVLSPLGPYPAFPTAGLLLFQFEPLLEVNATAG